MSSSFRFGMGLEGEICWGPYPCGLVCYKGKGLPFSCLVPDFQPCFELVFWQLLRNECSFCFSLLQVPINRQAMEGKNNESHHSNPVCNPIKREPRELKRGEKNRE